MRKMALAVLLAWLVSACTATREVVPTSITQGDRLCIIEDPAVREGFLDEYQAALRNLGIAYTVVPDGEEAPAACEWTSTYTARYRWNWRLVVAYVEIKVFRKGDLDGEIFFDGRGAFGKPVSNKTRIHELVNALFMGK